MKTSREKDLLYNFFFLTSPPCHRVKIMAAWRTIPFAAREMCAVMSRAVPTSEKPIFFLTEFSSSYFWLPTLAPLTRASASLRPNKLRLPTFAPTRCHRALNMSDDGTEFVSSGPCPCAKRLGTIF